MSEPEDLELEALQRQPDDAFETTRPRRGFEDELWVRMQARRPFMMRLREGLAGLVDGVREAPAIPAAAVATVLIVVIGVTIFTVGGFRLHGGTSETSSAQFAGRAVGPAGLAFGRVPAPGLSASSRSPLDMTASQASGTAGSPAIAPLPSSVSSVNLYLGPATLTWAGHLDLAITQAPVYRYQEPSAAQADQFGVSLGGSPQKTRATPGYLGTYTGATFTVDVRGSIQSPPSEPFFVLAQTSPSTLAPGAEASTTASQFLAAHSLVPSWPNEVVVESAGDLVRVEYLRLFDVPGTAHAYLVDASGNRYGLAVDLNEGVPVRAAGPLPLNLDVASYPIISSDQAVAAALSSAPVASSTLVSVPAVQLTSAELVYAVAWSDGHGFYEPCFLFSGSFTANGVTYVKRVLVPAVDPALRTS
jgi:hypothetical protein